MAKREIPPCLHTTTADDPEGYPIRHACQGSAPHHNHLCPCGHHWTTP